MKQNTTIKKLAVAILFVFAVQFVFAAFTSTGKRNNKQAESKYSLKNLSSFTNKGLSLTSLRYNSKLLATDYKANNLMQSSANHIQMQNGNTTFIFPYKAKIKVPKFKTPTPTSY